MKTFFSFLICTSLVLLVSLNLSSESQSSKSTNLYPVCNHEDPLTHSSPQWFLECTPQGTIVIDSQCCVNLWNFYVGNPPPTSVSCTIADVKCPEDFLLKFS